MCYQEKMVTMFGWMIFVFLLERETFVDATVCPAGKRSAGGACYTVYRSKYAWQNARTMCKRNGGSDLLVLTNNAGYNDAIGQLNGEKDMIWVGASDLKSMWNFQWVNGTSCCGSWWLPTQPDFKGKERCVHLYHIDGRKGLNNYECDKQLAYACQYEGHD